MDLPDTPTRRKVPLWRRVPVGVGVMAALLLLLHGPGGAVAALWNQAWGMLATLLGGEQVVLAVVSQTAPLALATALVVFAWRQRWLKFESLWSVAVCSGILLGAASMGVELRGLCQRLSPADALLVESNNTAADPGTVSLAWLKARVDPNTNMLSAPHAARAMTTWSYAGSLGASEAWPDRVPRVALLPEERTLLGVIGQGINQLVGYLAFYRPRMFLAALVAGGYLGWAWHRRYEQTHEHVVDWAYRRSRESPKRRAA